MNHRQTFFIPIIKPSMGEPESLAASRPIRSGWVTQGPEVAAFEKEFAAWTGAKYACAVSSCTAALHLALLAVGVRPGDEVVTVSHTFIATANSIYYSGAVPVFVDVEPGSFNLNPDLLAGAITEKTRAVLCVHQMGMPCDLKAILETAHRHSLAVIEDAACAVGSEVLWNGKWEKIGRPHGDIACFSFHPRKIITTGDGGMMTTSNPEWDRKFRIWRHNGMEIPDELRHRSKEVIFESYPEIGFNYRMTDIQAAVGREQLKRLDEIVKRRRALADRYRRLLSSNSDIKIPEEPSWARSNWQSYGVRLSEDLDQKQVMQSMLNQGVATRRGIMCVHREPAYERVPWRPRETGALGESEQAQEHCILLPLYPEMAESDQTYVVEVLKKACEAVGA